MGLGLPRFYTTLSVLLKAQNHLMCGNDTLQSKISDESIRLLDFSSQMRYTTCVIYMEVT